MPRDWGRKIQEKYEYLLERIGIWLIYTRSDHRFRCRECFDLNMGTSRADCASCFGTGYQVTLERWHAFYTNSIRRAAAVAPSLSDIGWGEEHRPAVFCRRENVPVVGDRFFVVEWDTPKAQVPGRGQPIRIADALRVVFVEPNYTGELRYQLAHCEFVNEAAAAYNQALLSTAVTVTRQ